MNIAEFDYVIVGAGSAGCVVAARLSAERNTRVALVEAGGSRSPPEVADPAKWPLLQGSTIDWQWRTVAQDNCANRRHDWPRGRIVGGSSTLNAMAHVRGHPADFDAWARQGAAGWGFADLLPYFIKSETSPFKDREWHGNDGPIHLLTPDPPHPITEAYMAAGVEQGLVAIEEHNGAHLAGPTLNTLTIKGGRRQSVADAYLTADVLARPNLVVHTDCLVDRVLMDNHYCHGVRVHHDSAWRNLTARAGVVLCAGTVGSPTILQRSGIGNPKRLQSLGINAAHALPGVGENLQDHLLAGGNLYRAKKPVPASRYQHSESLTYIPVPDGADAPDVVVACVVAPVTTECFEPVPMGEAYTLMYGVTHPRSRGYIHITSANPNAPPHIDPRYLSDPYDRRTTLAALDWARRLGHSTALSEWRAEELLPSRDDLQSPSTRDAFIARAAYTHHHPVGTCKLGADKQSVVDSELKVHGLEGLYVVDASVMPSLPTGPINAAVVAIAEKAADKLAGETELHATARGPRDE